MKKPYCLLMLLLASIISFAQKSVSRVEIGEHIIVSATIESFDSTKHKYDTCDTGLGWKVICLIDGKPWFGSDAGINLPRNQIIKMFIEIDGKEIPLDVSGMFNPNWNNEIRKSNSK